MRKQMFDNYIALYIQLYNLPEDIQIEALYAMTNEDRTKVGLSVLKFKTEGYVARTLPEHGMLGLANREMFSDPKMLLNRINKRMELYDNGFNQEES